MSDFISFGEASAGGTSHAADQFTPSYMSYAPIEDHGLIGNMHTAALVSMNGSIDWLCWPHFDAPSIFARILDDQKGGHFSIVPKEERITERQVYWPDTNILITRFLAEEGIAEIVDYMPVGLSPDEPGFRYLIRRIEVVRGEMPFEMTCRPAFNYAQEEHELDLERHGATFRAPSGRLGLATTVALERDGDAATARFSLKRGQRAIFVLEPLEDGESFNPCLSIEQEEALFERTVEYWQEWIADCNYEGRWREQVYRSALVLKLLTYEPTGAVIAAPTTSLPEEIGGVRNWDYRYTWMRDASFTIYALLRLGFTEEAAAFTDWIHHRCEDSPDGSLHILYDINGNPELQEESLDHLEGYKGSSPVRIGNGAYDQLQIDIYGELMDAVYLYNKHHAPIAFEFWELLARSLDWVCENWDRPDNGIWEVRSEKRHHVFSKLMSWVALDRGIRLADKRSFPSNMSYWYEVRDKIYLDVMEHGWSEELQSFVQHYGGDELDASNLVMPLVFFASPNDPRMLKTINAIMKPPEEGGLLSDSLVYRYDPTVVDDGLPGKEGSFNMCTFWLVEALTRAGRVDEKRLTQARLIFEKMLSYSNHIGLFAEQTGSHGEALGNFPQAFTHLSLISAAFNLDRTLDGKPYGMVAD